MRLQLYRAVPELIPHDIQESPKEGIHRSGSFGQLMPNTSFKMPINMHSPSLFICVYRTPRRLFLHSQFTKPSLNIKHQIFSTGCHIQLIVMLKSIFIPGRFTMTKYAKQQCPSCDIDY
jgi:hypothetical protein